MVSSSKMYHGEDNAANIFEPVHYTISANIVDRTMKLAIAPAFEVSS